MIYEIISQEIIEEYDSKDYTLEQIFERAFVVGNSNCVSAEIYSKDEKETYHVTWRSGIITNEETKMTIGNISNDVQLKYGLYGKRCENCEHYNSKYNDCGNQDIVTTQDGANPSFRPPSKNFSCNEWRKR